MGFKRQLPLPIGRKAAARVKFDRDEIFYDTDMITGHEFFMGIGSLCSRRVWAAWDEIIVTRFSAEEVWT